MNIFDFEIQNTGGNCKCLTYSPRPPYIIVISNGVLSVPAVEDNDLIIALYDDMDNWEVPLHEWHEQSWKDIPGILAACEKYIDDYQRIEYAAKEMQQLEQEIKDAINASYALLTQDIHDIIKKYSSR